MRLHYLCNKARKKARKKPITLDRHCCALAKDWAKHLAKKNKLYHGKYDNIISRGYRTIDGAFNGWMHSSGHRNWLLHPHKKKVGFGIAKSHHGTLYVVGVFR